MVTFAVTLLLIALQTLALWTAQWTYPDFRASIGGARVAAWARPLLVASVSVSVFLIAAILPGWKLQVSFAALCYCGVCFFDLINVAFIVYLGDTFLRLYKHLPKTPLRGSSLRSILSYTMAYVPRWYAAFLTVSLLMTLLALLLLELETSVALAAATTIALLATAAPAVIGHVQSLGKTPTGNAFLEMDPTIPLQLLHDHARLGSFRVADSPRYLPQTILLIINESAGDVLQSSDPAAGPLRNQLRALSGHPQDWFVPTNVVTNSSCTDVSIPSILTGSGAHESVEKLHEMPFLFDMAKSMGYETSFFTSSVFNWANFEKFFASAPIDVKFTAESTDKPFVNDMCIDDMYAVTALREHLQTARGPQFVVLYINALHVPYQSESILPIPDHLQDRRSRAVYLIESAHRLIFETLHAVDRFGDALIFSIGDHGETADQARSIASPYLRLDNYCDAVLRPLFLVKPPRNLPAAMKRVLHANLHSLIANVDIAPTIAELLSIQLTNGHAYVGQSLFARIPASRLAISINTNEWRSWSRTAVAMARGTSRLVFDSQLGCEYFDSSEVPLSDRTTSDRKSALLAEAYRMPILRENLARLYRDQALKSA